jgi:uncharacterized protein YidB (DUF937 family)
MGLFDSLQSLVGGGAGGDAQQALSGALDNSSVGGVSGIMGMLQQSGLGAQVASWVPGGDHAPISADQIQSALGNEQVQALASQFGVQPDQLLAHLSEHLPGLAAAQQGS